MSGATVGRALQDRFEQIRRAELSRLARKLSGLSDLERQAVEAVVADVVDALARPAAQLADDNGPAHTLEAIVRLFRLEPPA